MHSVVTYVELDLNRCSLSYGVGACTAAGSEKCFNTRPTCQDKPNYTTETETIRFCVPSSNVPADSDAIPSVTGVDYTPARLDLGESIGVRASATITFGDHRFPDTGPAGDRYVTERAYDPFNTGTFWGKFRARHSVIKGAAIRIIQGDATLAPSQLDPHHLIVESVTGPDSKGQYTITAKDVLKMADPKRAMAPSLSGGYLSAAITAGATAATLAPAGIGDIDYPASGYLAIGGAEVVAFTRTADALTLTRGQWGTTAQAHDSDDRAQTCVEYTGADPADIFYDLLTTYAGVDPVYIPLVSWQAETATYVARLYTTLIAEPTSVTELINELLQQTATSMWFDDITKLIRIRTLREVSAAAEIFDDSVIISSSYNVKDQPGKRVSQVWTYYGLKNPLEGIDDAKNYRSAVATVDPDGLTDYGEESIRTIFSRWIPAFGRSAAKTLNDLILSRYASPPRSFGFRLMRSEGGAEPSPGGGYRLSTLMLQGPTGEPAVADFQATSVKVDDVFITVTGEEALYSQTITPPDPLIRNITIDTNATNIDLRAIYDSLYSAPTTDTTINVIIEAGVVIGSTSTSLYSLRTGLWPENPTLNLTNLGRVEGMGGAGGAGGNNGVPPSNMPAAGNGGNGGNAMLIEYNTEITNNGDIWAGGGGGGGSGAAILLQISPTQWWYYSGSGGGGGAGYLSSAGGSPGALDNSVNQYYLRSGGAGASGTQESGGAGGTSTYTTGGAGGGPALSGATGSNVDTGYGKGANGTGGAPGNAIVQSGGTASIITTGDIRGAIV
jgi:hypothetical protein